MTFPRVLILAMGRINAADTANNGLLLRNLFGDWPRERLAQIYSGGDNGDQGFFGHYYTLTPKDRRLGRLFFSMKAGYQTGVAQDSRQSPTPRQQPVKMALSSIKRMLVDTGTYEAIFQPQLSSGLIDFVAKFKPDIVFSQGYSLTFARLPVMLARRFGLPVAYYPTDDWPNETYRINNHLPLVSSIMDRMVGASARRLVETAKVRLAFNPYMRALYQQRYGRSFVVLMHGDHRARFKQAPPLRSEDAGTCLIVATGIFNDSRLPLLDDLDDACALLALKKITVRARIYPVNDRFEFSSQGNRYRYLDFSPCPSHEELVPVLKGADILFLPERFDASAAGIATSVSSKAHLFMFSQRPTIVYSAAVTGIARYAREEGWALTVERRSPELLAAAIEKIHTNSAIRERLVEDAADTAMRNHHIPAIQSEFRQMLTTAV